MITIFIYASFSIKITEWRAKNMKEVNQKDQIFNQRATDALLNFETVKFI